MAAAYHLEALRKQRVIDRAIEARGRIIEKEDLEKQEKHKHHHHHHKRTRPASAQLAQLTANSQSKKNKSLSVSPPVTATCTATLQDTAIPQMEATPQDTERSGAATTTTQVTEQSAINNNVLLAPEGVGATPTSQLKLDSRASAQLGLHLADDQQLPETASQGPSSRSRSSANHTPARASTKTQTLSKSGSKSGSHKSGRCCSQLSCCSYSSCNTCCTCVTSRCSQCHTHSRGSGRGSGSHTTTCSAAERKANEIRHDLKKQELVLRDSNLVMGQVSVEQELQIRKMQK